MSEHQHLYPIFCIPSTKCYESHEGQLTADKQVVAGLTCVYEFGFFISTWLFPLAMGRVMQHGCQDPYKIVWVSYTYPGPA